jgi:hypothetical protein
MKEHSLTLTRSIFTRTVPAMKIQALIPAKQNPAAVF